MRCSRPTLSIAAWSGGLTMCSDAVAQVVQRKEGKSGALTPVRCLVATRAICRGERICVVPESHILHGASATQLLQRAAAEQCLPSYATALRCLATVVGDPSILSTRDALLVLLAVYVLRWGRLKHPLTAWSACLPPRVPPMGVLLQQIQHHRAGSASFEPLQRRLRIGYQTVALRHGDEDAAELSTELMLQAAEHYGIEHVGKPQTEVLASQALMTSFYRGTRHPLTQRQHDAYAARQRHVVPAETQQLLQLEESLHSNVLKPLLACLSSQGSECRTGEFGSGALLEDHDAEATMAKMEQLRLSHFMVRSRAVNLHPQRYDQPQIALVPFLDMLNHSVRDANVTYQHSPGVGVVAVASRPIRASEELTLNYGDYRQRGCLFSRSQQRSVDREETRATMRRIESRQLREWDDASGDDADEDLVVDAPFGHAMQQQKQQQQCCYHTSCEESSEEARTEATWLWRFGFPRGDDEKAYVASRLWSKSLRRRIAQLTDVRRKGRPGEFVIGVPEGLQRLREQREKLERERFGGSTVFPPQNA
ncbi:hypothetical protein TraAM80_01265 [Trypanosoma rangeli]|uniref:SET domain-containing protein n=1 Tax=Trypanosoma rangeli TaxID=5698 RepID=A0A422NZM7_TRYRA|nr:uncharacterized protein TraAM80_01265 [Trypanosoma rangeli]RNF10881.1 hypothetical protein TraAM80_01265 [Trypanosoma rangeli]|eukprot:RNF10881.1 hypothetical protein TraAM80_01265 [Trypanosoma rangeli]